MQLELRETRALLLKQSGGQLLRTQVAIRLGPPVRLLFFVLHEVVARLSRRSRLLLVCMLLLRFLARVLVPHTLLLIHLVHLLLC